MHAILADLVAEQQALDQYLQTLNDRDWDLPTGWNRWTVRHQVGMLAAGDEVAHDAVAGSGKLLAKAARQDLFAKEAAIRVKSLRPQEVIELWRASRAELANALSRRNGTDRVPGLVGDLSVRTMATARLTQTWSQALDIHHTFDSEPEDTARLEHIAWMGWKTLPFAFEMANEEYAEPVRVVLSGPAYERWSFGDPGAPCQIKGKAGEWCRVAVRRLHADHATSLVAEGKTAEVALSVARANL
ncbi:MAG: maleylpyruvate isomerase family mycothiol-dependent enzyme [Acidimicrobiia bacterium]|nr:maleylpyruvate isomerase family mycothiol-dependent enzyme [Acidimicrobiia bacterium]